MRRRIAVAIGCAALLALVLPACRPGNEASLDTFSPLSHAWELEVAGRDLSGPETLGRALETPSPRMARTLTGAGSFSYRILDPTQPRVVMWHWQVGADPFEAEGRWIHACADVGIADHSLTLTGVSCPADVTDSPSGTTLPAADAPEQVPWGRAGSGTLATGCEPDDVEVIIDQFQIAGSQHTARLSARNTSDRTCTIVGRPGVRLVEDDRARVVTRGGGSGVVRLAPGQSSWTSLSWRPTAPSHSDSQRLEATLGRSDVVRVQWGYAAPSRPFQLSEGSMTATPWHAAERTPRPGVAGVSHL